MSPGVGTNGRPNPCSDVLNQRTARSPNGREPYGDGVPIVVRVRENRTHGEGGQVDLMTACGGTRMRDAETTLEIIQNRPARGDRCNGQR
jgi:hypothetical protein